MSRSEYFPKALGVLQIVAGASYLLNSVALILLPSIPDRVSFVLLLSFLGELITALWLAVKGVRIDVWERKVQHVR